MNQLNLFDLNENNTKPIIIQNGEYIYIPNFFNTLDSNRFMERLNKSIEWKQETMFMYGKEHKFPRLTAWYGDQDKPYSFSGVTLAPKPWNEPLLSIKHKVEKESACLFNSVLLNLYRNGNDSISWHTDAEKELGNNPIIASLSFGATRKFQLKHIHTKQRIDIELCHGSLLVMQGEIQHYWQHQVPKTKVLLKKRINLTFRNIL